MGAVLDTDPASTSLNHQVLSLALPALGALIAEPLFVLADSAMVGHLGAVSLAGLSLASTILTTTVGLFVFLAYATTATTARLFGATGCGWRSCWGWGREHSSEWVPLGSLR